MTATVNFGERRHTNAPQVNAQRGRECVDLPKKQHTAASSPRRFAGRGVGSPTISPRRRAVFSSLRVSIYTRTLGGGLSTWAVRRPFEFFLLPHEFADQAAQDNVEFLHGHNYGASREKRVGEVCRAFGDY